ncbi:hypothetical protein DCF40_01170 [Edwardsiella piscicida]|uniref:hypothetical protein n=1 Tax=Edwardsiella piscicida TaxID=1263550 RepID=UPI001CF251CE|nr:hypothetical protein [Edwardsiella piscicida]UCQ57833.1 hypothetical protein DCF40_01170 [Edwardsiella piscicida]
MDIFDDIDVSYNRSAATVTREASVYLAGSEQIICEQRSGKMMNRTGFVGEFLVRELRLP